MTDEGGYTTVFLPPPAGYAVTPQRSTFSLAQLLLLVMLTGMLCAWLPEAVKWNQRTLSELPERQISLLSQDGTVYFCRSGERGFAAFDATSGECLVSEPTTWSTGIGFDPSLKRVHLRSEMTGSSRYTLGETDLPTGHVQHAVSPSPRAGLQPEHMTLVLSGRTPQVHDGKVYDFLIGDGTDASLPEVQAYLRCWNISSASENFCVPVGEVDQICSDMSSENFVYLATEQSAKSSRRALFIRDADKGLLKCSVDFSKSLDSTDGLAFCHRSDNLAVFIADLQMHHSDVIRNESEIYLTDPKVPTTPKRIAAIEGLQISQIAFAANDETIWHLGMRDDGIQVLTRRNVEHGFNYKTFEVGREDATLVTDFRLVSDDKQVAVACDDGTFRVLDAESGTELRSLTGLKYSPSYVQILVLAGAGIAWIALWSRATLTKQGEQSDFSGLLGFAIFFVSLVQGIFLLNICDGVHDLFEPAVIAAAIFPGLGAIAGVVLLFNRRFNKLTTLYGIFASVAMLTYTIWVAAKLQ